MLAEPSSALCSFLFEDRIVQGRLSLHIARRRNFGSLRTRMIPKEVCRVVLRLYVAFHLERAPNTRDQIFFPEATSVRIEAFP